MAKKQKTKTKIKQGLSQKERFIKYAKQLEVDETGDLFSKIMRKILKKDVKDG